MAMQSYRDRDAKAWDDRTRPLWARLVRVRQMMLRDGLKWRVEKKYYSEHLRLLWRMRPSDAIYRSKTKGE